MEDAMSMENKCLNYAHTEFVTINQKAGLKETFELMMTNIEGPPHKRGVVVVDDDGQYVGLYTTRDLAHDLKRFYDSACAEARGGNWADSFFNVCELAGVAKIGDRIKKRNGKLTGASPLADAAEVVFDQGLPLVALVDDSGKCAGVITRARVFQELGPKMFK
jgi:CBS domain-containing protein